MERFIDPRTLARVKDMPLIARTVADGFLHGLHQSHQRGVGIEFSQYRGYEPGDDPARIDWKLFARSDRYFVREAERESEMAIWFVLDASASMSMATQRDREGPSWNKFDYARHLLAALAWLAHRQGDHFGMLALSARDQHFVPLATGERQWHAVLRQLAAIRPGDQFPPLSLVQTAIARLRKPGMVCVISDFYQRQDEIIGFIRQMAGARTEVVAMQLQCDDELTFPWRGATRFEDLETGEQVLVSGRAARDAYLDQLARFQEQLRQDLLKLDVGLNTFNIDQPMDAVLHAFLDRRQKQLR